MFYAFWTVHVAFSYTTNCTADGWVWFFVVKIIFKMQSARGARFSKIHGLNTLLPVCVLSSFASAFFSSYKHLPSVSCSEITKVAIITPRRAVSHPKGSNGRIFPEHHSMVHSLAPWIIIMSPHVTLYSIRIRTAPFIAVCSKGGVVIFITVIRSTGCWETRTGAYKQKPDDKRSH